MNDLTFKGQIPYYRYADTIPKKAFDKEYATQMRRENEYLTEHGVEPTFVKMSEYGVRTYKYKKTEKLFRLLSDFYGQLEAEKEYDKISKEVDDNAKEPKDEEVMDVLIKNGAPIRKVKIYA